MNKYVRKMPKSRVGSMLGSTKGRLPLKVVFHQRTSSTKSRLPQKVVFHWRSPTTEGCLPPKVVTHQRSFSTEGCLPMKVVFHRRSFFTKGRLPTFFWRGLHFFDIHMKHIYRRTKLYIEAACCQQNKWILHLECFSPTKLFVDQNITSSKDGR